MLAGIDRIHIDEQTRRGFLGPLDEPGIITPGIAKHRGEGFAVVVIADHQPRLKLFLERTASQNAGELAVALLVAIMGQVAGDHHPVSVTVIGFDIGQALLEIGDRIKSEDRIWIEMDVGNVHKFHHGILWNFSVIIRKMLPLHDNRPGHFRS